jgi:transcriptional regulator with XRE-family HTH domain|tara:strand:+ start:1898 stop:2557 length:660 start_codon:yes stop_codon:yes gene_type:complete
MAKASLLVGTDASPEAESRAVQRILSIYNRLKADEGLNQTLLAQKMGLKQQSAISQYFLGKVPLNMTAVVNFAQAMNVSPSDIYPELMEPVRTSFYPKVSIAVRYAIRGNPTIDAIQSVEVQGDLEPYAVQINVDDYLPYIAKDSFIVCSNRVKPQSGAEVFVELNDGNRFVGRFFYSEKGITQVLKLQDNCIYDLQSEDVIVCDMVIGTHRQNNWELK